jgi:hypothetical protein
MSGVDGVIMPRTRAWRVDGGGEASGSGPQVDTQCHLEDAPGQDCQDPVVRFSEVECDEAFLPLVLSFQHDGTEADERRSWPDYVVMATNYAARVDGNTQLLS